ncbi:hypothetical protein NECAME_09378 [Necator americanus]|uniref:Uncharacterized protein n=1 Tax=Necator americanus TaxID=51031 RepID=W2TGI7_NECAM|nr:hypothetical protein NECAME_09378 [Necator americanus]ETN80142.1 hypothetical protein NECAME_09378 [Necator americanus]
MLILWWTVLSTLRDAAAVIPMTAAITDECDSLKNSSKAKGNLSVMEKSQLSMRNSIPILGNS